MPRQKHGEHRNCVGVRFTRVRSKLPSAPVLTHTPSEKCSHCRPTAQTALACQAFQRAEKLLCSKEQSLLARRNTTGLARCLRLQLGCMGSKVDPCLLHGQLDLARDLPPFTSGFAAGSSCTVAELLKHNLAKSILELYSSNIAFGQNFSACTMGH